MRVLVACEFSGVVRDAFIARGHDAMSCDILPTDKPGPHYQGDVFDVLNDGWDLMIAHPPCTYLSNSGVCHLHKSTDRRPKLFDGAAFFKRLLDADIRRIAVENPIMHKYGKQLIGGVRQSQVIQPWMFGHSESKKTGLWLHNLKPLEATDTLQIPERGYWDNQTPSGQNKLAPSSDRAKLRSETYAGIASAMADQWGTPPTEDKK